jgi:hypothetical protein
MHFGKNFVATLVRQGFIFVPELNRNTRTHDILLLLKPVGMCA